MSAKNNHADNVYALDKNLNKVFVGNSNGGRNLYYCMGCKREVVRVKHKSYWFFRHYVPKGATQAKCTFNDESHRHKLAKDILQRLKRIKAPTLYKFPPNNELEFAKVIKASHFIDAHKVRNEVYFYEDNKGELIWGRKEALRDMNYLIRADSAFFDKDDKPILIIEFVATNKLTEEKKAKIKMLGIDTLRVSVPKGSPESIERSLINHTRNTKWIYNNEERRTTYLSLPPTSKYRISESNGIERRFFDESFKCRKARVNSLIFRIKRCLESEQYRNITILYSEEVNRVEGNTETHRRRHKKLREEIQTRVNSEFKDQIEEIEEQENEFYSAKRELDKKHTDLETRYITRRGEIKYEEEEVDRELKEEIGYIQEREAGVGLSKEDIKFKTTRIEQLIKIEQRRRTEIASGSSRLQGGFEQDQDKLRREFEQNKKFEEREVERIEQEKRDLSEESFSEEREEIQRVDRIIDSIKRGYYDKLKKEDFIKIGFRHSDIKFLDGQQLLYDFEKEKRNNTKLQVARKSIESGAYKDWID